MLKDFITKREYKLNYAPTAQVHAEYMKFNPMTMYDTLSKFTRRLRMYGYKTQTQRFGETMSRAYVPINGSELFLNTETVICWCWHSHEHTLR
jgi:hypothetical protein